MRFSTHMVYADCLGVHDVIVQASSLENLSRGFRNEIEDNILGASDMMKPDEVTDNGVVIGRISYNGRIWTPTGDLLYDPSASTEVVVV